MDDETSPEPVGYRRPPRHSRFRKGQSGNPSGRRKGSGIRSALEKVLDRKVTVTVDGERRKVPLTEALVLQLVQKAAAGDARSIREILKIADQVAAASPARPEGKRLVIERRIISPKDCNPALDLLGIVVPVGEEYKVAPWAVEAAMARKPRLKEMDRVLISNSTLKPGEKRQELWEPVVERPRGVTLPGE
ncbi:MAG: hypothetical protein IM658_00120 [Phenylobacterium sp.]|uniref:DUF5681 domain-containing protein n=1 Tax=Phenylobacterium sp. TaxID=1871053 RepID=UPI0025DE03AE|nr:DUF5681 domain-containing protein [Phenylobacterium sp.]MCA3752031.1 hypothetical protein [Phenylobacterium sp.]MCA6242422.1 hypothetical protein [Phenylobacterium sp.]MCA6253900.1 hypothetical protein [Phenylobacterium sp.]MCA6278975.1 hypothetical protein [Phenylobacterium sp.]MCA6282078.1 hypothetical protein [Phenylobacterium sp.]